MKKTTELSALDGHLHNGCIAASVQAAKFAFVDSGTGGFSKKHLRGFALVATLSLMILLTIIAVGMLSLSSIVLRSSSQASAASEAQQNARLAAMLALGELQRLAGQDMRVTASSGMLDPSNVAATGVWRSWEGSDREANGKPNIPNYGAKTKAGNPADVVGARRGGRFLGWLASTTANTAPDSSSLGGLSQTPLPKMVPLVSAGSVMPGGEVHALPTLLNVGERKGAMAWWVSGENSKAMLNKDRAEDPSSVAGWQQRIRSNGKADAAGFGLEKLDNLPLSTVIPSRPTLRLVDGSAEIRKIHDLTTYSRGLLTNSATGGWRKDLSLLSENFSDLPTIGLPSLTVKPGKIQTFSKAQVGSSPALHPLNPLIYPWADYWANADREAWRQTPAICSWTALVNYMLQYRDLSSSSSAKTSMPAFVRGLGGSEDRYAFQEMVRRSPVIARIHWIFSLCSREKTDPANPANTYQAAMMITPVLTLWNPYNVEIRVDNFRILFSKAFAPISFKFKVADNIYPDTTLDKIVKHQYFNLIVSSAFSMAPGSTATYGLNDNLPVDSPGTTTYILSPGYRPNGGALFDGLNNGEDIYAKPGDSFGVEEYAYSGITQSGDGVYDKLGIYMDVYPNGQYLAHRTSYPASMPGRAEIYPPLTTGVSWAMDEVKGINNKPFAGTIFGFRPATPRPNETKYAKLRTKGMLNSTPLSFFTHAGDHFNQGVSAMSGSGTYHPMNAPYDFSFQEINGWSDANNIPQYELGSNSGYIISGLTAGDGLTRCVAAELPTRPLQSLADLQHFDARNNAPFPPFHFNLIGNGSAHPIFAPDQLYVATAYYNGMCNDDTYLLNHLLFDDWFISSIAPDLDDFKKTEQRPIREVYSDHLSLKEPLPNRFYLPSQTADPGFEVKGGAKSAKSAKYAYETVASQLEVDGMINVNSVSHEAWKSWLSQGRKVRVPYLDASGSTVLDAEKSFAFPRTSIAGDKAADSRSGISNASFPAAAEFTGYRTLTETQIDALADEIIVQIRKRGPFLSLSEFVNRRLSTNKDLAKAGVIQQALDTLSESGSSPKNPFREIQALAAEITEQPPGVTDYKFPEAALGSSAFGMPGWIRQADILRPLAPMISVRDDTYTIRGYGDSRDKANSSKILARAWCELVVRRSPEYVDSTDPNHVDPNSAQMLSPTNTRFGRRFEVVSFRWLNKDEV